MTALTPAETSVCRASPVDHQANLLVFMDVFRGHPEMIGDWGTASTPEAQAATLDLFEAVARCDLAGVRQALDQGASPTARLGDLLEHQHRGKAPPPLRTPLDLAWWRQTHNSEGRVIYGNTRDDKPVRDLGLVTALLNAGAEPDARWLRHLRGESWEILRNPSFESTDRAILDRLAGPLDQPLPQGVTLVLASRADTTVVASAVPSVRDRTSHLWLHRAIDAGHWGAFHRWFDRGGAVGTPTSADAVANLWVATLHLSPPTVGPYVDQAAVHTAIARIREPLLRTSDTLYRKEVLGVLKALARPMAEFSALPSMDDACRRGLGWLVDLMDTRPLTSFDLSEHDQKRIKPFDTPYVTELGRVVERLLLNRTAKAEGPLLTPRERSRL